MNAYKIQSKLIKKVFINSGSRIRKQWNKEVNPMNKWKQVLLLGGALCCSDVSFAQQGVYTVTLQWGAVNFADSYRLEERLENASWSDSVIIHTNATNATLSNRTEGEYVYRVIGCVTNPANGDVLCDEVAEYSSDYTLSLPLVCRAPGAAKGEGRAA
jgi:hypothetical protein